MYAASRGNYRQVVVYLCVVYIWSKYTLHERGHLLTAQTPQNGKGGPSFTRGRFPRNSLRDALKLVEVVQREGHGEPVRRTTVFAELGRSATSGSASQLVASAIRGYGLLRDERNGALLAPTNLGTALVEAESEIEKLSAAWEVMYSNDIFRDFADKYEHRSLPADQVVIDYFNRKL